MVSNPALPSNLRRNPTMTYLLYALPIVLVFGPFLIGGMLMSAISSRYGNILQICAILAIFCGAVLMVAWSSNPYPKDWIGMAAIVLILFGCGATLANER